MTLTRIASPRDDSFLAPKISGRTAGAVPAIVLFGGMSSIPPLTGIVDEGAHGGQLLSWIRGE